MKKPSRITPLAVALAAFVGAGCSTMTTLNDGCPGVYSGVKYNRAYEESELVTWKGQPDQQVWLLLDLPFSALLDTVLLPYTAFASPRKHTADGPGCEGVE